MQNKIVLELDIPLEISKKHYIVAGTAGYHFWPGLTLMSNHICHFRHYNNHPFLDADTSLHCQSVSRVVLIGTL